MKYVIIILVALIICPLSFAFTPDVKSALIDEIKDRTGLVEDKFRYESLDKYLIEIKNSKDEILKLNDRDKISCKLALLDYTIHFREELKSSRDNKNLIRNEMLYKKTKNVAGLISSGGNGFGDGKLEYKHNILDEIILSYPDTFCAEYAKIFKIFELTPQNENRDMSNQVLELLSSVDLKQGGKILNDVYLYFKAQAYLTKFAGCEWDVLAKKDPFKNLKMRDKSFLNEKKVAIDLFKQVSKSTNIKRLKDNSELWVKRLNDPRFTHLLSHFCYLND